MNNIRNLNANNDIDNDASENAGENASEDIREDTGRNTDGNEKLGEDENIIPKTIDNKLEKKEKEDTMKYLSVWKTIVNNKKVFCLRSRLFTADFTMYSIQHW